jgi:hypothetical protein
LKTRNGPGFGFKLELSSLRFYQSRRDSILPKSAPGALKRRGQPAPVE